MTRFRILVAALFLAFTGSALAVPISFTHTGSGAGSLDGTAFGLSNFVITATGDTDDAVSFASGWFIDHLSASITIDGVGTVDFVTATRTFVNNALDLVGFSRAGISGSDLFNGPIDAAFGAWDMLSSIGPKVGTGALIQWTNSAVITNAGVLVFADSQSAATFEAVVSSVPEPGTLALLGIGLFGMGLARRKKQI